MIVLTIGSYFRIAAVSILFISFSSPIVAHGLVTIPRQRGALRVQNRLVGDIDPGAPFDSAAHYPAGDKNRVPGSGKRSVMRAASNIWTPYEPLHAGFQWRAGVCGDDRFGNQEHLKVIATTFIFFCSCPFLYMKLSTNPCFYCCTAYGVISLSLTGWKVLLPSVGSNKGEYISPRRYC